jgi:hypothetical protein
MSTFETDDHGHENNIDYIEGKPKKIKQNSQ